MIDEKKLIEEIEERCRYWETCAAEYDEVGDEVNMDICDGKAIELHTIIKRINEQPKVGEWISCSEKLPDNDGEFIVTIRGEDEPRALYFDAEDKDWNCNEYCGYDVVAWQPMPEPWKGEEE